MRETLGMDEQERGWKRGLKRKTGNVTHQQSTVCLTKDLSLSHFTDKEARSQVIMKLHINPSHFYLDTGRVGLAM